MAAARPDEVILDLSIAVSATQLIIHPLDFKYYRTDLQPLRL